MRTRSLTIRTIRIYKAVVSLIAASPVIVLVVLNFMDEGGSEVLFIANYIVLFYMIWKNIRLLKEVSYDDESLYVKEKEFEIQIPFYKVKDVRLISLDGVYKFELYEKDQFGDAVLCKPSVWYPFTYKKVDDELYQLRKKITEAKRDYWEKVAEIEGPVKQGLSSMNV